ncbi:MAG: LPXTG cell wall anchor domain-containing protein [Clostridiales bacterium]|nr:LPXTG cell wall anchor domain-containing protein [Clostridiales bacterium]
MKNIVKTYVEKFMAKRRRSHQMATLLLSMAIVISGGVFWQLRSTGLALTNETYCGLEEHQHTDECYEEVLVCGLEESEGHTHDESCYTTVKVLVCPLDESEGHTHDESCYDEEGNLICGLEESEGHVHSEECYVEEQVLTCGLEESEGHTHTEDCYELQLVCGIPEHTHTIECMSDENADVEEDSDWWDDLPDLTGVWADDVVEVAESQLGYTESTANFVLDEDGVTIKGYTRYGDWAGNDYGDWDAMFASFCLDYVEISKLDFPQATGAYSWSVKLENEGFFAYAEDYTPAKGDLVFFDTDDDGKIDSVGIVTEVDEEDGMLTVIEGDYFDGEADAVCENEYDIDDETIIGYGKLPENEGEIVEDDKHTLNFDNGDYSIKIGYGEEANLSEDVKLEASEYSKDSAKFSERYAQAAEKYEWEEDYSDEVRLFNISLVENLQKAEPEAAVNVTITLPNQDEETEYTVLHFTDDGMEELDIVSKYKNGEQTIKFKTDSFSDFMLLSTTLTASNEDIGYVLDGDYAYLSDVAMVADSTTDSGFAMRTGTAPWDDDDEAGNDSSATNNVLRTYDVATYTVTFTSRVRSDADYTYYYEGNLYFEFILQGDESEVQFETGSMGWLAAKNATYIITQEDVDGVTCQVLRGYYSWQPASGNDHAIGESTQELTVAIRTLAMSNGDKIEPTFTFWLEGNIVGVDYTDWGTEDYTGGVVTGSNATCSTHGETEYKTITAPEVTVSARPSYNVAIVSASTSKCQSVGTFDFSTGNDLALNKDAGEVYGRMGAYGIIVQIVELSSGQGLKGVELPKSGEDITFDLSLTSTFTYTDNNGTSHTLSLSDGTLSSAYTPLIWSFDANLNGSSQQDGRTISVNTKCADTAPLNELETTNAYYYNSCYNGGSWSISQNSDGTYAVKISNCQIDMSQIPFTNQAGNVNSTTYYDPDSVENYWEIGTACISAGELWVVQPFYEDENGNAGDLSDTYIVNEYGDGTFTTILSDTSLSMTTESSTTLNEVDDNSNQAVTSDDKVSQSMAITKPGTISQQIQYLKYNYNAYNDPLTDGGWQTGKDWILAGNQLTIGGWVSHDSAEGGYTGVAYDVLIKFDDTFFEPTNVVASKVNGGSVTVMYAAKSDKSGWDHNGLKPNEAGYDTEMIYADIDDLVYFSSLDDLENNGYTCVGILLQYRGLVTEQMNHIHYYIKGSCKTDVAEDYVYMVTHCCRVWNREELADASGESLSDILAMSTSGVNNLVSTYIPTATQTDSNTPVGIDYSNDYPSECYWINGGEDGVGTQSDNIRNYTKPYYDDSGYVSQTEGYLWGDSCLVVGYTTGVTLSVAQISTSGSTKAVYDLDTGQRIVDYQLQAYYNRNAGTGTSGGNELKTNVTMTVTLPAGLTYLEGSSYIGGTYTTNGEGVQGTVKDGTLLEENSTVNVYAEDGTTVLYTVTMALEKNEDGTTTLTYTLTGVTLTSSEETEYLDTIYFSCEIGTVGNSETDVENGESLAVSATIESTEDCKRDQTSTNGNYNEAGITVSKNNAEALAKYADQSVVEVGEDMAFEMFIENNSSNEAEILAVESLPYSGDEVSEFNGDDVVVTEFRIYTSTETDSYGNVTYNYVPETDFTGITFYYTTNTSYQGKTSDDLTSENFTDTSNWTELEINSNGTAILPNNFEPVAIVAFGKLEGEKTLKMHIAINLPEGKGGDYIVNKLTNGNLSSSAHCRIVERSLSSLAWADVDGDGIQDSGEEIINGVTVQLLKLKDGGTATNESDYEEVYYNGTSTPVVITTGYQVDVQTGQSSLAEYTDGYYLFTSLSAGTYAVRFSDGTSATIGTAGKTFDMSDFVASPTNEGSDETKDSDATGNYSDSTLTSTVILGIDMPEASTMTYASFASTNNDSGFMQYQLEITKVDVDEQTTLLDGVEFELTKSDDQSFKLTGTTDEDGKVTFGTPLTYEGLTAGVYILEETEAKDGYNNLTETITIKIGTDGTITAEGTDTGTKYNKDVSGNLIQMTITNGAGYVLPLTGGHGTLLYTLGGLTLCAGAGVVLFRRRRRA